MEVGRGDRASEIRKRNLVAQQTRLFVEFNADATACVRINWRYFAFRRQTRRQLSGIAGNGRRTVGADAETEYQQRAENAAP